MKSGDVHYFQVQNCISLSFYFFFFSPNQFNVYSIQSCGSYFSSNRFAVFPMVLNTKNRMRTTRHCKFNEIVKKYGNVRSFSCLRSAWKILLNDNNSVVHFTALLLNTERFLGWGKVQEALGFTQFVREQWRYEIRSRVFFLNPFQSKGFPIDE